MNSKYFILGGDIKKSLVEGYQFDFKTLFKDAFTLTQKNFFPLFTACLFILLSLFLLVTLSLEHIHSFDDPAVIITFFALVLLVLPPLVTGLLMMGVNHAIGLKSKSFHLFSYLNIILKLSLAAMMINLLVNFISLILGQLFNEAGFVLSVLVMFYLRMSFCLVYPLMAEKKLSAFLALTVSFKLVNKNIKQFTVLLILFAFLFIVGVITSGIGLLFVIPFYVNTMGLIYRQVCGVTVSVTEVSDEDTPSSHSGGFEA